MYFSINKMLTFQFSKNTLKCNATQIAANKRESTISTALIMESDPDENVRETLSNLSPLHY